MIQETESVRRYELCAADTALFKFQPGQFVAITFAELPEGNNERSYSIASVPSDNNVFEICVVLNPAGKGTPALWSKRAGDELQISEAKGHFVLPENLAQELVFICTGTGVAPFRSMIGYLLGTLGYQLPVTLIFGNRFEKDILYRNEFENWEKAFPNFRFVPVLSRETNWPGKRGYVHAVYEELYADGRDARFFVCGWEAMCTEARHKLKNLGYNRRQYLFEDYG